MALNFSLLYALLIIIEENFSMIRSLFVWITTSIVIFSWLFLLAISRLFDRDPVLYRTGFLFRKLGKTLTQINPAWKLHISGETISNPRLPYVVVCNHQSMADIPLISNLPWEMKWMAKKELFNVPVVGWMMRLSGDISVDRKNPRSGALALIKAQRVLEQKCSVMIFPEGTRTLDGRVRQFTDGAFHLAIKTKIPILPLVIEGSRDCIPKNSWIFGKPSDIFLKVLPPIATSALTVKDVPNLRNTVRAEILKQIAEWRSVPVGSIDGMSSPSAT
jgi:1-acyl-sn-glycerol-3-phosphate acyltransferase